MINRKALDIRRRKGLRQCKERWQYEKEWLTPRRIGRAGVTPVPCSCLMCGNHRRTLKGADKLTMQERRVRQSD
jgi:hypothetical protein